MRKGARTRAEILDQATELAARIGLEALSIGILASLTGLSKSGLYAHFGSKEDLQLAIVQAAAVNYERLVIEPTLRAPRGEPRVRSYVEHWLRWAHEHNPEGGCFFIQASAEFDDQPGAVRDALAARQQELLGFIEGAARRAVEEGHFVEDLDCAQFAFELWSIALGYHHSLRMMRDPDAARRTHAAVDALLRRSRRADGRLALEPSA